MEITSNQKLFANSNIATLPVLFLIPPKSKPQQQHPTNLLSRDDPDLMSQKSRALQQICWISSTEKITSWCCLNHDHRKRIICKSPEQTRSCFDVDWIQSAFSIAAGCLAKKRSRFRQILRRQSMISTEFAWNAAEHQSLWKIDLNGKRFFENAIF